MPGLFNSVSRLSQRQWPLLLLVLTCSLGSIIVGIWWYDTIITHDEFVIPRYDTVTPPVATTYTLLSSVGEAALNVSTEKNHEFEIEKRGKWQNSRIQQYCLQHKLQHKNYSHLNAGLLQHLIFDDVHKVVYCHVPKAGCTMMTTAFILLQKLFTLDALEKNGLVTHMKHLSKVKTFRNTSVTEIEHKLETYYKFMIVRNPFERLYSSFNDKLTRLNAPSCFRRKSKAVLKHSHDYTSQVPNFKQFARTFVETSIFSKDGHFRQMVDLCDPCSIQYDFYLNFANMSHDVSQMFQLLDIPQEYYFNKIKHTTFLMPHPHPSIDNNNPNQLSASQVAYNQLKPDIRNGLNNKLSKDIEFFRMLYPELMDKFEQQPAD